MYEAFVYCWTDNKTGMLYIGSHKGAIDDGYVCSSKIMNEQYSERRNDFTRQIIATGTWDDMFKLEGKILVAMDAKNDPTVYNQHNGSGDFRNKALSEESRKKISISKRGKISPRKGVPTGRSSWNKGKTKETDSRIMGYAKTLSKTNMGKEGFWKGKNIPEHVKTAAKLANIGNNNAGQSIMTPYGIFASKSECSRKTGLSKDRINSLIKRDPNNWKVVLE